MDIPNTRGLFDVPIPNHIGVPKTKDFKESRPRSDTANMVDLNTISSVRGPYSIAQ